MFGVSGKKPTTPTVNIDIQGKPVPFIIDMGASVNIMTKQTFMNIESLQCMLKSSLPCLRIYAHGSCTPLPVRGQVDLKVKYKDSEILASFFIVQTGAGLHNAT